MTSRSSSRTLVARLVGTYMRPYAVRFAGAMAGMTLAALMTGGVAKVVEHVPDMGRWDMSQITAFAVLTVAIFVLRGMATYMHTVMMNTMGQRIITDIQNALFSHLLSMDLSFFHRHASGTLVARLTNDVMVLRGTINECTTSLFRSTLTLMVLVGLMFYQDWRLALVVSIVLPSAGFIVGRLGRRMRKVSGATQEETGHYMAFLGQTFQGIRHVKAYGMEGYESTAASTQTEKIFHLFQKGFHVSALGNPLGELMAGLAIGAVFIYGGTQIAHNANTPGALLSFVTAFLLAYEPLKRLGKMNTQLQTGLASAERLFAMLDIQPHIVDAPDAVDLRGDDTTIRLDRVVFAYPDGTRALDTVSLSVPHGKTVAIVGASGAGKSTIINLIPRFFDVAEGSVTVGGQDVRAVRMQSLRAHMAFVSQESVLFDDTVRANIAYGRHDATDEDVEDAARAAFAHDFITALPDGYNTVIGEHGVKLSGGQRQRISIARAIVRHAPILLLDEATSALDNESERMVQEALRALRQGRTTLIVAHRLSTIMDADHIVVMDRGRVVEEGTHTNLLAQRGLYARLYGAQG